MIAYYYTGLSDQKNFKPICNETWTPSHAVGGNYQEVYNILLIMWMHTIPGVTLQVLVGDPE